MVRDYLITFYENKKVISSFTVAAPDSLVAENIGNKMASVGVTVVVSR
jgi:hypothetical protein